jgi:sulfatase modifying factor 1
MQAMLSCPDMVASPDPTPTFLNADQALPANCIDFYTAYALCIWDGGRLPTEAEWNYAAAGGSEQRYYPWSDPPSSTSLDATRAVYGGSDIAEVGSVPAGNGRFGQSDLEGNVAEWTLDYAGTYPTSCVDCLQTTISTNRQTRGASYAIHNARGLKVALRGDTDPASPASTLGFRCVHDL